MNKYKDKALAARRKVLTMIHKAGTSHIASNFSVIDIATVLYENLKPGDQVVWSKGWAAATIYYFLAQQGKIPTEDLEKFPEFPYIGLAETSVNGVLCNGGAVGHGTPVATGIALGKKRAGDPGRVYCVMSDGELNEGTVWESVMVASHHKLNNLVFVIDVNKWQAMGKTSDVIDLEPIEKRFGGFGFFWLRCNGHNYDELHSVFNNYKSGDAPMVIICDTIKGKGVSWMENHLLYHYKNIDDVAYKSAMKELV
jgi:transketolase